MAGVTTRLGLIKPAGGEPINVDDLNTNSDKIDKSQGSIFVNAGVTPPDSDLYDGCLVIEKTTGIVWLAQKSGSSFLHRPLIYPFSIRADNDAVLNSAVTSDRNYHIALINRMKHNVNGTAWFRQLATNNYTIDIPVKGLYQINFMVAYGTAVTWATTGMAAVTLWRQSTGTYDTQGIENIVNMNGAVPSGDRLPIQGRTTLLLSTGESIRVGHWQQSGTTKDVGNTLLEVTLITPAPDALMP